MTTLNSAKSPGPDGWPPFVLKKIAQHICLPLYIIFSNSLATRCVPDNWKRGHVVPIYKKGCRKQASNYRPITLTSIVGKLLESIVRDSLLTHFNTYDLLSSNQHGFIPGRSCVTQLLSVLDDWTRAMMEGHNTSVLMLYTLTSATVPHKHLIHKLRAYGIGGRLLEWLQSFLSDREQRVVINSVFSSWRPVTSGVPQGSVLGPLLFAIYVNDLPSIVSSNLFMFADDLKLYRSITQPLDTTLLQHDINALFHWTQDWLLNLSIPKCYVMSVGNISNTNPNYILDNVLLTSYLYLCERPGCVD